MARPPEAPRRIARGRARGAHSARPPNVVPLLSGTGGQLDAAGHTPTPSQLCAGGRGGSTAPKGGGYFADRASMDHHLRRCRNGVAGILTSAAALRRCRAGACVCVPGACGRGRPADWIGVPMPVLRTTCGQHAERVTVTPAAETVTLLTAKAPHHRWHCYRSRRHVSTRPVHSRTEPRGVGRSLFALARSRRA